MWTKLIMAIGAAGLIVGCAAQPPGQSITPPSQEVIVTEASLTPTLTFTPTPTLEPSPTPNPLVASAQMIQPCYLLPLTDIERITGVTPDFPPQGYVDASEYSDYVDANCKLEPPLFVSLRLPVSSQSIQDMVKDFSGQPVDGLGDQAFWNDGTLDVIAGDVWLQITFYPGAGEADNLETARELVEVALERIDAALDGHAQVDLQPGFDPCLLTADEEKDILNLSVDPIRYLNLGEAQNISAELNTSDVNMCEYWGPDTIASISDLNFAFPDGARWDFENQTWQGGETVDFGDAAFWVDGSSLIVLRDTHVITIGAIHRDSQVGDRDRAYQIAKLVLGRIH